MTIVHETMFKLAEKEIQKLGEIEYFLAIQKFSPLNVGKALTKTAKLNRNRNQTELAIQQYVLQEIIVIFICVLLQ